MKHRSGFSEWFCHFIRAGDTPGKTGERPDDFNLVRSFMQSAAGPC